MLVARVDPEAQSLRPVADALPGDLVAAFMPWAVEFLVAMSARRTAWEDVEEMQFAPVRLQDSSEGAAIDELVIPPEVSGVSWFLIVELWNLRPLPLRLFDGDQSANVAATLGSQVLPLVSNAVSALLSGGEALRFSGQGDAAISPSLARQREAQMLRWDSIVDAVLNGDVSEARPFFIVETTRFAEPFETREQTRFDIPRSRGPQFSCRAIELDIASRSAIVSVPRPFALLTVDTPFEAAKHFLARLPEREADRSIWKVDISVTT